MSSPWGKIERLEPVNLKEIMSQQMAFEIQSKEDRKIADRINEELNGCTEAAFLEKGKFSEKKEFNYVEEDEVAVDVCGNLVESLNFDESCSDEVIANMLQKEYDKEYDDMLKRTEDKYNAASKIGISFCNYRRTPAILDFESDSEEEELVDVRDRRDWDRFDTVNREFASIPPCGYRMKMDGSMLTKHDGPMSGRRNACKLMSFPPEFETGDGAGFDFQLPNKVFNSLKVHSKQEQQKKYRIHDKKEDHATAEFGVDEFTRLLLFKMINNTQILESVNGVISIGKEAVVLHATGYPMCPIKSVPNECCIKVFKTTLSEFKQRDQYIKDDYRFKDKIGKQTARKTVHIWAEKEMANLQRLKKYGIPCPEVVHLKKHVLVMSFLGHDHRPAPKLKDALLKKDDLINAYDQVVEIMKTLYSKANLIHADLSEYNILWYNDQCYFIDVSQSVELNQEKAFHFLMRDCGNISNFFNRKGVPEVATPEELFKEITGCDFEDKLALLAIQESFKMKPHLVGKPGMESTYNFDSAWEKAKSGELPVPEKAISVEDIPKLVETPLA